MAIPIYFFSGDREAKKFLHYGTTVCTQLNLHLLAWNTTRPFFPQSTGEKSGQPSWICLARVSNYRTRTGSPGPANPLTGRPVSRFAPGIKSDLAGQTWQLMARASFWGVFWGSYFFSRCMVVQYLSIFLVPVAVGIFSDYSRKMLFSKEFKITKMGEMIIS